MNPAPTMSLASLISQASIPVQFIMALLLVASISSWAVIFAKRSLFSRTKKQADAFEDKFWSGGTLVDLYEGTKRNKEDEGVVPIFSAGFEEYTRQQQGGRIEPEDVVAAVQRQMRVAQTREVEKLEGGLSLLATIGSVSPYVGLLGTVWGIMSAFIAIGSAKNASLAMVAPGIAEALIATAIGLFAAIPAVVAYNFFSRSIESFENRYTNFSDEMIGIIERALRAGKA